MTENQPQGFRIVDRRVRPGEIYASAPDGLPALPADLLAAVMPRSDGSRCKCPPGMCACDHCDEPTTFASVIDELREQYRPGVPDDQVPPQAAAVTYAATCSACNTGNPRPEAMAFTSKDERDRIALGHARGQRHVVTLIEESPATGSTITGYVQPDPPPVRGEAPAPPPPAPALVAFVAREQGPPDLICRIPPRAGAAWLLTAAHACLLGRGGSLGIERPHRVLYIGRVQRNGEDWQIRIDGLIGARPESHEAGYAADGHASFGDPVGAVWDVDGQNTMEQVEQIVEARITETCLISRHLFEVIVMTDGPVADPPDQQADAVLRAERRQAAPPSVDRPWTDSEQITCGIDCAGGHVGGPDCAMVCSDDCATGHTYREGCGASQQP